MYLGMYSFRGDPAELLAAHDRLLAMLPAGQLELHLCVQSPEGIIVLDSCPSRDVFDRFSSGREFRGLVAAAGLPEPEARGLGEVRGYVLPGGEAAP